jgi:hypothetical protein
MFMIANRGQKTNTALLVDSQAVRLALCFVLPSCSLDTPLWAGGTVLFCIALVVLGI